MEKSIYNGLYFVLPSGEIKTYNWRNTGRKAILKPATDAKGYLRVGLQVNGKLITQKVHRLVASSYISNPNNYPCVNHIDGNKKNNSIENLEWVTYKENTAHAIRLGLFSFQTPEKSVNKIIKRGELNGVSILKEYQVLEIRDKFKVKGNTRKVLSLQYGVTENCIKDVVTRKSWKHV